MILTVTINPAVDKSTTLDKMIPEKKLRCAAPVTEAGGGGINVSKAVRELEGWRFFPPEVQTARYCSICWTAVRFLVRLYR